MTSLFSQIESMVPGMDGWCTLNKAMRCAALVTATRPTLCLEIGTYSGRSAIPIALALQYNGHGTLIGVDPYDPIESAKNETQCSSEWWGKLRHEIILEQFLTKIRELGLQNVLRLERMTSDAFQPPDDIDIFHCDGSHGPQALIDTQRYASKVRVGGYVIMDDINWCVDGKWTVRDATQWLEGNGFAKLYEMVKPSTDPNQPADDWALYQRTQL